MVEDTVLLPVFVSPACEAPHLIWADSGTNLMSLSCSTTAPFKLPEILIAREGLDKGYCQDDKVFHVIVEADQGSLTSNSTAAISSSGDLRAVVVLEGRIWDLNLALKSVEYQFEIHREAQIPVTASVGVRVLGETSHENNLTDLLSSALLQLKLAGDIWLSDMLARETIVGFEDTDMLISDEIILDWFAHLAEDDTIIISVQSGAVYAAADLVHMEASDEHRINAGDVRYLRSVMSNLRYIPSSNFNGIDEIHFKTQNQESTLYIYIQAENDPPEFKFNAEELKDWYKYPRKFIPTFQIKDPDDNHVFQVDIRADNGSLSLDQISSLSFDGVTVELSSSSSSLRMTSSLSRLNTIFLQRLVEVVPNNCVKEETMRVYCDASIEICVDDGSISVCQELRLPQQELFYRVTVPDWTKSLNVSLGSSLNLSNAFEIHQRFDAMFDLILRVHVSSGFVLIDVPNCAELRDVADSNPHQRSALTGVTQTIYTRDIACLNEALATLQLQSAYSVNNSVIVQLELFSDDMKLLADESIIVNVTDKVLPRRISSLRATDDKPWLVTTGSYANLLSLANVSISADPVGTLRNESNEDVLQLDIFCSKCKWKYQEFVPRVSYEFAQIPSSKLRFLGLMDSLNEALRTLELTMTFSSDVGESWSIPGIYIGDGSGQLVVDDDDLDLEIEAGIEPFFRTMWDEMQHAEDHDDAFTPADTVVDKVDRWNAALETLQCTCSGVCDHQDTTVIQVRNLLAPLPVSSHQQTIRIDTLYDVPIPRVTSGASLYYSTEDSAFQFPDLALQFTKSKAIDSAQDDQWSSTELSYRPTKYANPRNDEDNRRIYQLEIRVSYGSIFMIGTDRLSVMSRLKMEGNVTNLERDLKRLVYSPPQNWNEEQFPGGHIVEWQFVVSYQNKSVESFTDLVIMSRVDAPVISVPHALEDPLHYMNDYLSVLRVECLPLVCDEDTPMALDGFSVRSADSTKQQKATADLLVISLSVSHGVISLGDTWRTNCISRFVGAQSWKRKSFKANVDCVNRVLTGTEYIGEPNFSGTDQLKIRVEFAVEPGGAFEEITVPIIVIELNDAPYIAVDSVFYEADEDIPLVINDLLLRDPDALDELLSVIMETNYGQLALLRPNGVKLTTERVENAGKNGSRLTLEGTLRNIDAAVASVVYTSAKDWNSLQFRPDDGMNGFDTITITSTDLSSFNGSSVSVLFVYVDPKPDPVLIDASSNGLTSIYADDERGTLRGDEDTWIIARGLSFSSADGTSRPTLVVSLSVTHGLLSLSCGRGLTFLEGSTDGGRALEFKGTFTNVNACMIALRYLPNKDFYGQDSLVVTATAVDEYTQQQTPSSSILVSIMVDAVNDAPVWNVGSSIVREIQQDQAASIAGVSFHDVDVAATDCTAEACVMDLIIEASSGVVTLPDQSPPLFSNDMATKKVAYTVLSGTPDELNMLISDMTFMLAGSEYYRADSPSRTDIKLQLTVDDRGVFGSGGPQISTTTIIFSPVMWSRYKFSLLVPEAVLTLNEDTAFGFGGDLQLIDPDSAGSFRNIFEFSINCTNGVFALSSRVAGVQVLRNDSDSGVIIRGFFAQLNAALNGSSYIPAANWYGSEEISLSVVELNHLEKTRETVETSIFLFVAPVCDEPQWATLTDTPLTMKEDEYLLVDKLSLTDPDLDGGQHEVEVTIGVAHGGVMLSMTQGLLIEQAAYSTSEDRLVAQHVAPGHSFSGSRHFFSDLVVRGRVSDINAAFKGMVFKPWLDYNSDGWPVDEIVFAATSFCGNSKTTASHITIPIAVFAVNDPPVLISQYFQPLESSYSVGNLEAASWSSSIEASEHSPQQLESTELYDPDDSLGSGDLRLLVNVSCIHCSITSEYLSHPSETQPSDDLIVVPRKGKSDESVQLIIHGTLVSLNSGLMSQLIFQGADNFNGLAFVLVEISDLGNYGEGGTLRSVFVLCVKVKPVNDISQANLPQYQSQTNIVGQVEIRDNEPPTISIASTFYAPAGEWVALAGIEITDPDSVEGILYVSLAVHNGKLRVTLSPRVNSVGPTALHSTVDGAIAQKLEFATTAEQANEIFQTLEYRCDDDNGCSKSLRDYLRVHVDDNGFTGAGGSQVATKRAEIVVA
ncbi:hypothetical protein PC117_g13172 [Phytophthora cactorum]|uniref:Cadherin domain-containing protein n=1 Tax=Phytophthora cactorum TaxID=29920 RepID=A0A8T1CWI3_9STRA|nr:hypothetical protein PC117_g13172 [Phytophthora cactorum]